MGEGDFILKQMLVDSLSHKHQDACVQVGRPASRHQGVFPLWPGQDSWRQRGGQGMLAI